MTASPRFELGPDVDDGTRVRWTSLGRRLLIAWLAKNDVSTDALARDLEVTGGAVRNLTSGKNAEPSLTLAHALQKRTGVPWDAWLSERTSIVTLVTGRRGKV